MAKCRSLKLHFESWRHPHNIYRNWRQSLWMLLESRPYIDLWSRMHSHRRRHVVHHLLVPQSAASYPRREVVMSNQRLAICLLILSICTPAKSIETEIEKSDNSKSQDKVISDKHKASKRQKTSGRLVQLCKTDLLPKGMVIISESVSTNCPYTGNPYRAWDIKKPGDTETICDLGWGFPDGYVITARRLVNNCPPAVITPPNNALVISKV